MQPQTVIAYPTKRPKTALPLAFTEHGVTMLASILTSKRAIEMNIEIVEAFITLKEFSLNYKELSEKLKEIENGHNKQFTDIHEAIHYLLQKDKQKTEQKDRDSIGFKQKEEY